MHSPEPTGAEPQSPLPTIAVIGTFDTKAAELANVADHVEDLGGRVVFVDTSARLAPPPDKTVIGARRFVDQNAVAGAAGRTMPEIDSLPRGEAVTALRDGVTRLLVDMVARHDIDGAVCMGGAGTHIAGPALQQLPFGFPKLIVSPLASGRRTFEPYVGIQDVAVLHSVADISGINSLTSVVYRNAAGFIVGAAMAALRQGAVADPERPLTVAVSMNGNTTPTVDRIHDHISSAGMAFVAFHANGTGGRALEAAVENGQVDVVIDVTTTELSGHLIGGLMDPGPARMETAGRVGLPQILVPGCVDLITCGKPEDAEREFPGRTYFGHNPELTLVRLTAGEMEAVAKEFARKANSATGPVHIVVPTQGLSVPNAPGGSFWDPEADEAFRRVLRAELDGHVQLSEIDAHINDPTFSAAVTAAFDAVSAASARHETANASATTA
ncbi:Tm-1-like ATP-binding domain-containing protein [Williamsia sp. D3]|uniref:Tm-1-like ATP-binding domain-containing protein n=1 Tax=Williamsia sp. D3 TaxID=1313067 RepID=UPI0003F6E5BE|nr:Tm-1-like ATP-binding domain-containing protein [Williamsia sp. D3]